MQITRNQRAPGPVSALTTDTSNFVQCANDDVVADPGLFASRLWPIAKISYSL